VLESKGEAVVWCVRKQCNNFAIQCNGQMANGKTKGQQPTHKGLTKVVVARLRNKQNKQILVL